MPLYRCERCLAVDVSADAHPARALRGDSVAEIMVCRDCYRAAELEFRIACDTRGLPYAPLALRDGLRRLAFFYRERLSAWADADLLLPDADRERGTAPIRAALDEVERRLRLTAVRES